jgi:hypothetical protein
MGRFTRITVLVCRNCQGIGQVDCTAALYRQDAGQGDIVGVEGMLDYPSAEIQADMQIKYPDAYDTNNQCPRIIRYGRSTNWSSRKKEPRSRSQPSNSRCGAGRSSIAQR